MFEVGFTELLVIFVLALIVLGPEKLPKLAQQVGRWVGRARAMARQFREQLEEEATTLERKFDIDDLGIDTSLEPKPKPAPDTSTSSMPATPPEAAAPGGPGREPEDEFYPPDHHMHSSNQAAHAPALSASIDSASIIDSPPGDSAPPDPAAAGAQAELDLTTPPDATSRPAP